MYYGTRAEDQEGCRKPEIVEGEGFKQFKIYKVECCYAELPGAYSMLQSLFGKG